MSSLGGTGLRDWLVQRYTAVFLAGYTLFLLGWVIAQHQVTYESWLMLFSSPWMQISTLFALVSIAFHAWVGLWTVLTDYVKPPLLRYLLEGVILFTLFGYVIWGIFVLWG
ncbi:MAG: succinate dehydrogenase, hydrophobic membrane anchor protein [Candidatus Berkiella sp.]